MKKKRTLSPSKAVALLAVVLALTFVTSLLPAVFLVPLIIAAILLGGLHGFIASCFFAGVSIMYAFMMPTSPVAVSFTLHPWVAVVPRLVLGTLCWLAYKGTCKLTARSGKKYIRDMLPVHVGATVASVMNTVLVVSCLVIFYGNEKVLDTTIILTVPYMLIMSVVEVAAVNAVCPLIVWALKKTPMFRESMPRFGASAATTEFAAEADNGLNTTENSEIKE